MDYKLVLENILAALNESVTEKYIIKEESVGSEIKMTMYRGDKFIMVEKFIGLPVEESYKILLSQIIYWGLTQAEKSADKHRT